MKSHDGQFLNGIVHFDIVLANLRCYHNLQAITAAQAGMNKYAKWPITKKRIRAINIATQNEQQNLHENKLYKNTFGECTCNHSTIPHFCRTASTKAEARATTATQQRKLTTIRKPKLKVRK